MPIRFQDGNALVFQEGTTADYKGPILSGGIPAHAITEQFSAFLQALHTDLYSIRYNLFQFRERLSFLSDTPRRGLFIRAAIKGDVAHTIEGADSIHLKENSILALWAEHPKCTTSFETGISYRSFDIYASPLLTEQLQSYFPGFQKLITAGSIAHLCNKPCFLSPAMHDVIREIMECPYDEATSRLYFDIKVKEFLFLVLHEVYKSVNVSPKTLSEDDIASVIEARDLLLKDLRKTYTIAELSRAVGINTFKLKTGFKQVFNAGVFECLQDKRMESAREMIVQSNMPLKEIALLTGYPRITNFITAFRKKFGYTPGSLRR